MRNLFFLSFLSFMFFSCKNNEKKVIDVSEVEVQFSIDRFDVAFYTSTEKTLPNLKEKYPSFFPKQTPDSVWVSKIKEEQELFLETQKYYANISFLNDDLEQLFKRIKYHNPNFKSPKVITLLNSIDYENRVIYTGDLLLISLDVYLGIHHGFYADYPKYIKQNFTKNHIVIDVAKSIIESFKVKSVNRSFVSKMVEEGKSLYMLDVYLPYVKDYLKIGYSNEKNNWALTNEEQVWKYFVENKLLFSTDSKLDKRFIDLAPFSKFYRSEDNLSPGKIGSWIGWQIVKSYMKYNDIYLQQLFVTLPQEIYKKSKYKPKR